ncbi:MAG TPA: DUF4974 domain-containing protein [Draconibacterium sp.]|nr:DUF4974 domain-containing protein [Draconibacterium sp.]
MINQFDIEKLKRFREDNLPESELPSVYSLFAENENNLEFEKQIRLEFCEYVKNNPTEDFKLSPLLDRIHHMIHNKESKTKLTVVRIIYRWYSIAAAVLLIPLLIASGIWFSTQKSEDIIPAEKHVTTALYAPLGSRISFNLPDGTKGWLNSGSSLEYQIPFSGNRKVSMTGEAWFHVAKDEAHPFEITGGKSTVKVLGTKFNMNAYPEEKYVEVVLEEGKVQFTAPGIASAIEMNPDERLIYTSDSININITEPFKYSAWKEGKLVFRSDPMEEVARRIERWYNVDVKLMDTELKKYVIRGTFQDDSLEDVFRYLAMTSPLEYRIIDRKILNDGTFQKSNVLVYKKKI